ncbi:MAG: hypothetical protein SGPRY_011853 [Prymnesium sp.]
MGNLSSYISDQYIHTYRRCPTQVLADDLTGNGRMDLLVSTMNGNVYCFETDTPYAPLRAWRSQAQGRNVFSPRESFGGVEIKARGGRHEALSITGAEFVLTFAITDNRRSTGGTRRYNVQVRMGARLLLNQSYTEPGEKTVVLPCPREHVTGVLTVTMLNEHGLYFEDRIAVSFNEGFLDMMKWIALLPYIFTAVVVYASTVNSGSALPI